MYHILIPVSVKNLYIYGAYNINPSKIFLTKIKRYWFSIELNNVSQHIVAHGIEVLKLTICYMKCKSVAVQDAHCNFQPLFSFMLWPLQVYWV